MQYFFAACVHYILIRPFFVISSLLCYSSISLCVTVVESFPLLPLILDVLLILGDLRVYLLNRIINY